MLRMHCRAAIASVLTLACGTNPASNDDDASTSSGSTSVAETTTSATTTTTTAPADTSGTGTSDDTTTTTEPDGCPADALIPGQYNGIDLEHDGVMRTYNLYVPVGHDPTVPAPLLLNFHGYTSNAAQQQFFSSMDPTADAYGLVVAYPQGLDQSWNAGTCCGTSAATGVDDVGFALAVIADAKTRACLDPKRVYATGMSNGGFLSHRLACEQADSIAAIAPVAGVIGIPLADCNPTRPVPVLHFHGTEDALVPYEGGTAGPGAVDTVAAWSERDGCAGTPTESFNQDDVHCEVTDDCEAGVRNELCTVEGGGHCWPGTQLCPYGTSTLTISASDRMAEFFLEFTLP
jgi:polyhydroxybutyrate depolymerase